MNASGWVAIGVTLLLSLLACAVWLGALWQRVAHNSREIEALRALITERLQELAKGPDRPTRRH